MRKFYYILFLLIATATFSYAQSWHKLVYGTEGSPKMLASCVDKFNNYYTAGAVSDTLGRPLVYKWTGSEWDFSIPEVNAAPYIQSAIFSLCSDSAGNLYAAGTFKNGSGNGYVAKWNGVKWVELGLGNSSLNANGDIYAICTDGFGNIYAAGDFTNAAGFRYVAKWNGSNWQEVGSGVNSLSANAVIRTLYLDTHGNLYAGGGFSDDVIVNQGNVYVAKWNGATWNKLGNGICLSGGVMEIYTVVADQDGKVYAGGRLDSSNVAMWNGANWEKVGMPTNLLEPNGDVFSLCFDPGGNLYAGGSFTDSTMHVNTNCFVAQWNGNSWSQLGEYSGKLYPNSWIQTLCSDSHGEIYAAGECTMGGGYGYVGRYGMSANSVTKVLPPTVEVSVSPNPAHSSFNISIAGAKSYEGTSFLLLDVTGRQVATGKLNNTVTSVDIRSLPASTYILKVGGGTNAITVVKE